MVSFSHISVYSVLCQCIHTNTRILKPFEDCEPTGLKVDIANIIHKVLYAKTNKHTHYTHTHTMTVAETRY